VSLAQFRSALVANILGAGRPLAASRGDYDVYRRMARGRLRGLVEDALPRTRQALGDRWDAVFEAFLLHVSSPYLRDEVAHFAAVVPAEPPWLPALAALELASREVAHLPGLSVVPVPLALEAVLPFARVIRRVASSYRVEETPEFTAPGEFSYLVYRDDEDAVQILRCEGLQSAHLGAICEGISPLDAVRRVAAARGAPVDAEAVDTLVALIHTLLERKIFAVVP
jgi:hypothetical protein